MAGRDSGQAMQDLKAIPKTPMFVRKELKVTRMMYTNGYGRKHRIKGQAQGRGLG